MPNMMRSMIVLTGNGEERSIHHCPTFEHKFVPDEYIPEYYSELHASDSGWVKTRDTFFCEPDKNYVWVCPECIERVKNKSI